MNYLPHLFGTTFALLCLCLVASSQTLFPF